MKVELIDVMGDDLRVANVARVSFNKWKEELDDKDVKLIHYLAKHEHTSPFRHVQVSIRCEAPLFIARQLGKHQVGLAWNEVSRRYVDDEPHIYCPNTWRAKPEGSIKQGSGDILTGAEHDLADQVYTEAAHACLDAYDELMKLGVAPEMARMILPQSMMTSWIWTGSLQAMHHIYRLRSEAHAQKEVQEFAHMLGEIMAKEFPHSWSALNG